jgi:putative SOS response-associated peptidase YedK
MCGRFVAMSDPEGIVRFLTIDDRQAEDLPPRWNVAPTDPVHAAAEHEGRRVLVTFRWGLVPSWASDARGGARMINARSETVADKPAFRTALSRRRCLIPADGFYEWTPDGAGGKQPHFIHHAGGTQLAFAGLWETWRDPADAQAPPLRTCTILTTAADGPIRDLHHRMPVALDPARWDAWLDRDLTDARAAAALLDPIDPALLVHHPVSTAVSSVRNDGPELIHPVDPPGSADEPAPPNPA